MRKGQFILSLPTGKANHVFSLEAGRTSRVLVRFKLAEGAAGAALRPRPHLSLSQAPRLGPLPFPVHEYPPGCFLKTRLQQENNVRKAQDTRKLISIKLVFYLVHQLQTQQFTGHGQPMLLQALPSLYYLLSLLCLSQHRFLTPLLCPLHC